MNHNIKENQLWQGKLLLRAIKMFGSVFTEFYSNE